MNQLHVGSHTTSHSPRRIHSFPQKTYSQKQQNETRHTYSHGMESGKADGRKRQAPYLHNKPPKMFSVPSDT